ncbi:MAG TPA: hypothetical protein VM510_08095, partial [Caulifigura sp.]|nr:hypothetical protein [Caulifigura sp.]
MARTIPSAQDKRADVRTLLVALLLSSTAAGENRELLPAWRRPAAAALLPDGRTLAVANEGTGTVTLIELAKTAGDKPRILSESPVGTSLTDLIAIPRSNWLLATDFASPSLHALQRQGGQLQAVKLLEHSLPEYSVGICLSNDGKIASIASLWGRSVTLLSITAGDKEVQAVPLITLPLD